MADRDGTMTAWTMITVETADVYIATPVNQSPADLEQSIGETPTLTTSAFSVTNGTDTHIGTEYSVTRTSDAVEVYNSGEVTDLTSHVIPAATLEANNTQYTWTARHKGSTLGWSEWSTATSFTTAAAFGFVVTGGQSANLFSFEYAGLTPIASNTSLPGTSRVQRLDYGTDGYLYAADGSYALQIDPETLSIVTQNNLSGGEYSSICWGLDDYLYYGGEFNVVSKVDPTDMSVVNDLNVGGTIFDMFYMPEGHLYAADRGGVSVYKIDTSTMSQVDALTTGISCSYIYALTGGADGYLYVGGHDSTVVDQIDPATMSITNTCDIGSGSRIFGIDYGNDGYLYVLTETSPAAKVDPSTMTVVNTYTTSDDGHDIDYGADGYLYLGYRVDKLDKIDPNDMTFVNSTSTGSGQRTRSVIASTLPRSVIIRDVASPTPV